MKRISFNLLAMISFIAVIVGCKKDDVVPQMSLNGTKVTGTCVVKTEVDEQNSLITYFVPNYTPEREFEKCALHLRIKNGKRTDDKQLDFKQSEVSFDVLGCNGEQKTFTVKREVIKVEKNSTPKIVGKYKFGFELKKESKEDVKNIASFEHMAFNNTKLSFDNLKLGDATVKNPVFENTLIYDAGDRVNFSVQQEKVEIEIDGKTVEATINITGYRAIVPPFMFISISTVGLDKDISVEYICSVYVDEDDTKPLFITLKGSKILSQKFLNGNLIYYGDSKNAATDYADIECDILLPEGATYKVSGAEKFDFTNKIQNFEVTSVSGKTDIYSITREDIEVSNGTEFKFEEWKEYPQEDPINSYFEPEGWATPNYAVLMIKAFGDNLYPKDGEYPVSILNEGKDGKGVTIKTIDTKGGVIYGKPSPKVTSGTIFTGSFNAFAALEDPLKTTAFGLPYTGGKPLKLTGWYKYTPGEKYFEGQTEVSKVDEPAISVVLYDVTDDIDAVLTGVDIYTSSRIVAMVTINPAESAELTEFSAELKYSGVYDPSKSQYKLAMIFSSSKDGALYKGAPGSILTIDEVKLVTE